jgi:ABC transporter
MRYPQILTRYPSISEGCDEANAALRAPNRLYQGWPRRVLRPRFRSLFRRGAGRGRPERLRQDLAVAPDRGSPGAGRRVGRPGRRRGRADPAGTIPLSRPPRCAEACAERAREPLVLARLSGRQGRRRRPMPRRRGARPCHASAGSLSAGQRRRLSIARLLVVRRSVWLLDEPTSALDAAGQGLFVGVMRDHLASGGIIIAATHAPLGIDARELRMGETK